MAKIFISYSRVDEKNFVEPFVAVLREHYGYPNVWYDRHLIGGQSWWSEILKHIAEAEVFVWVLSNDSVMSEYCLAEYEESQRLGKPVVTVQARDRIRIPPEVSMIQYVDMSGGRDDIADALKIINLIKAIDYQAEQPTPRRPKWKPSTPCPTMPDPDEEMQRQYDKSSKLLPIITAPRQQKSTGFSRYMPIIGAVAILVVLIALGLLVVPGLLKEDDKGTPNSSTSTDIAAQATPPEIVTEESTEGSPEPSSTLVETATEVPSTPTPTIADDNQIIEYRVISSLNVRSEPSLSGGLISYLNEGDVIETTSAEEVTADGLIWVQTSQGWVAKQTEDGNTIYLSSALESVELVEPFTFERFPVDLDETTAFYYYGNTMYAYTYGAIHNFDGYSQGLHGGIDFYARPTVANEVEVFAGVYGTLDYAGSGRAFGPARVDILVGDYLIIYGHITINEDLPVGTEVTPDTVIGTIPVGSNNHTHIEIREDRYILNPLLFFTEEQQNQIFEMFPPEDDFGFYSSARWQQWLTPLDQPTIQMGGPVIGPRS